MKGDFSPFIRKRLRLLEYARLGLLSIQFSRRSTFSVGRGVIIKRPLNHYFENDKRYGKSVSAIKFVPTCAIKFVFVCAWIQDFFQSLQYLIEKFCSQIRFKFGYLLSRLWEQR